MLTPAAEDGCKARPDPARLFAFLACSKGLLLAVSGGPDSVALMLLMTQWRDAGAAPPLFVATVDHGLRSGSAAEAAQVADWAARLGLSHATLAWGGERPRTALQEKARDARYALLADEARRRGCDSIVTAHHADDQAETILFRLLRGSGLDGLAGMERMTQRDGLALARPLLHLAKAELVEVCRAAGQDFIQDPSNADPRFARARLRRLMPEFAREGLGADGFARLARRAARAASALEARALQVSEALPALREPDAMACPFAPLAGEPEDILLRVLAREIARIGGAAVRLERLEALAAALLSAHAARAPHAGTLGGVLVKLDAKGRLTLRREGRRMRGMG